MSTKRRSFLAGTLAGGLASLGLAACGEGQVSSSLSSSVSADLPTLVLVHGSLHGAFCWARVTPFLVEAGFKVLAVDLPGCGLNGRFPVSSYARPFDPAAYSSELSPVASVTLEDYTQYVGGIVDRLYAANNQPVVLVGHSLGGVTLNSVGESHSSKIRGLVYLSAIVPGPNESFIDCLVSKKSFSQSFIAQGKNGAITPTAAIGAARFDLNSPDPAGRSAIKDAFCGDISDLDFLAWANMLVPDDASGPENEKVPLSAGNWGSIPRSYIKCALDNIVPPDLADEIIAAVDNFTPTNKTVVDMLDASHSSFLSRPEELANLITSLALR